MLNSEIQGLVWPPLPGWRGALIVSFLRQFERSQWWSAQQLEACQFRQINMLVEHFKKTSPYYRERLEQSRASRIGELSRNNFHHLPILTREDFQNAGERIYSENPPEAHGEIDKFTTSGSTGKPVTIKETALSEAIHWATFIRNDIWHGRDFGKKFAHVQAYRDKAYANYPAGEQLHSWNEAFSTGPLVRLNVATTTLQDQLEWLKREKPAYIMSFPSNLEALARLCMSAGEAFPWLDNISTIGEQLSPAQRRLMSEAWGVPVCETYGCAEATYIAFQSPENESLLVQSESVFVEILDEQNQPCEIGQRGRVVVTALHNFATPIIRYEVGDLAVWAKPNKQRGLPVIDHILGRSRNAIQLPGGEQSFPLRWCEDMGRLAPIRQWQLIQKSYSKMELKLVTHRPLSRKEEAAVLASFKHTLGGGFTISPEYVNEIPRAASGKYEEFRCDITNRTETGD